MIYLATSALIFLLIGIFTSKQLIGVGQLLFFITSLKCLYDSYKDKKLALPKSAYWLLAFIFIAFISILINDDIIPRASINRAKLKYPLFGVLGIYFFRYWLRASSDTVKKWTLNLFFISVIVSSVYGIITFFTNGLSRINGLIYTMKQGYGSAIFLILLLGFIVHQKRFQKIFTPQIVYLTFLVTFTAMFMTYTRGAMLGFLCGVPVLLFYYKKKLALAVGSICFVLGLGMTGYYFLGTENSKLRFLTTNENNSDSQRRSVWLSAVYAIKESPAIGLGYSNFKPHMKRIKDEYNLPRKDFINSHTHNNFLEIAAGTGLIGLFFFLGWLITWARESYKSTLGRSLIFPFGVVFIVSGLFEVTIIDSHLSALIYLVYSLSSFQELPNAN